MFVALALTIAPWSHGLVFAQSQNGKETKPVVVPVFSLAGPFTEMPMGDDMLFGTAGQESFQQLLTRLKKARDDQGVKAVVLLDSSTALGSGQIEEVRQIMDQIKAAGKEIHVHADSLSMQTYVLLSAASKISVVPTGDIWLTGMNAQSLHLRGLLDKLSVTPDFLTCGAYKSAAETFTRKEPSPEADENLNWLLDGIFNSYVDLIAAGRGKTPEAVKEWIDEGLFSAEKAKQLGIIDAVEYRNDFERELKSKYGEGVKFDKKYGRKSSLDIDLSSPFGLMKFYVDLLSGPKRPKSTKDAIAIVYVEGPILPGKSEPSAFPFGSVGIAYSTPIRKALEEAADDDSVKGVVLRVNSPGGSAVASEIILQATRRVKEKKPIVVSMGDVAGSGGYYVACGADTIFADPSTITASIGVVAGKLATTKMWDQFGINFKEYPRGKNSGMLSSGEPFSDSERDTLQSWMDEVYEVFKGHVLAIRRDRLTKDLEEMAGGRVYTGRQARDLGLVDQLGGLDDAIQFLAKKVDLKENEYEIRQVPRPKNFAELITESLQGGADDDPKLSVPGAAGPATEWSGLMPLALPALRDLEPERVRAITTALIQLRLLQNEHVALTMPLFQVGDR